MAKWTVTPVNPNDPPAQNDGNGNFTFDTNDEDHDIVYNVTYTDDNGCTQTTQITQEKATINIRYSITGNCFCDGIDYETILYYPYDPSHKIVSTIDKVKWEENDTKDWFNKNEGKITAVTKHESITYQGETYEIDVPLTSVCAVRSVLVELKCDEKASTSINLTNLGEGDIPAQVDNVSFDIALDNSLQDITNDGQTIEWPTTDKVTYCDKNNNGTLPTVNVTLPNGFEAVINGNRYEFIKNNSGLYTAQTMSDYIAFKVEYEIRQNKALYITIKFKEGNNIRPY